MSFEEFFLRKDPVLKITFDKNQFEIFNEEKQFKKVYEYEKVDSVELVERKTNWFVTLLSFIVSLLFESASGDLYKDNERLILHYENGRDEIDLKKCDLETVKCVLNNINEKIEKGKV